MISASKEKDRLETKQRSRRKLMEESDQKHTPAYFVEELCEEDNQVYFKYNSQYFEKDR